jgi:hypothetical protein
LQRSRIAAATAATTGDQSANGDQFARDWSLNKSDRASSRVGYRVLARWLINAAHADNVPTVFGAVVTGKSERHRSAVSSVLGSRSACGHWTVQQHHGGITAEIQAAIQRVHRQLPDLQSGRVTG